jgi:hypothetical protein
MAIDRGYQSKMKVRQVVIAIGGVALAVLGVSMALTNPGKDAYEQYAVETLTTYLKDEACMQAPSIFGNVLRNQCKSLVDTGRPQIEQIITQSTQQHNFIFFSIYRTDLEVGAFLPAYQFHTLGVFQNFYTYQAEEK